MPSRYLIAYLTAVSRRIQDLLTARDGHTGCCSQGEGPFISSDKTSHHVAQIVVIATDEKLTSDIHESCWYFRFIKIFVAYKIGLLEYAHLLALFPRPEDFPNGMSDIRNAIHKTALSIMSTNSTLDALVALAHVIAVTGEQDLRHLASVQRFVSAVSDVISDQDASERFLDCRDRQAQSLINALHLVLRTCPPLEALQQAQLRKAQLQLSLSANLLPTALYLPEIANVQTQNICRVPNADICRGSCEGRAVCLKKYRCYRMRPEEAREITMAEATIWSTLVHQNIVPLLGVAQHDVQDPGDLTLCLVTPFPQHGTIVDYLAASSSANRCLLVSIFGMTVSSALIKILSLSNRCLPQLRDVIEGLSYLHSNHIVHGTIKAANILVTASGRASIANVGPSDIAVEDGPTWTRGPWVLSSCSIAWKAPELLLASQSGGSIPEPTRASDIYALACVAYEVFTNKEPFWHLSPQAGSIFRGVYSINMAVLSRDERPTKPEDDSEAYLQHGLTAEIWAMMEECWSEDPLLRPSAAELAALPFFTRLVDERSMSADY
ncbi:hypothetical protein NMY22_g7380 [Coprinellus aureogranulatus]|nr:hypothetical protein NMY22_g7380 [Coprinellus aureogranulatus]